MFSLRVEDATSQKANLVRATLDIEGKALVVLDEGCGSIVRAYPTKNPEPRKLN